MRILVLAKRQYMSKDLLDDRYGRLFEFPAALAARGHDVTALLWSYRRRGASFREEGGVRWWSEDLIPMPWGHWRRLAKLVEEARPDVIWSSLDAIHVILGAGLQRRLGIPVVADLYDDYESYRLTSALHLTTSLRRACSQVSGLSVISHTLARAVQERSPDIGALSVIGNGVPSNFRARASRNEARQRLGLPMDAILVGTAGALDASRGIEDLFEAVKLLRTRQPGVQLVIAGPRDRVTAELIAGSEEIIDLGSMAHDQVPWLYTALDIGVVCNRDSAFGRACHPQKLVEMAACGLPAVVAAVGDVSLLLDEVNLYPPGDAAALADRLEQQLKAPMVVPSSMALQWNELAVKLEALLERVVNVPRRERSILS
jgi:glycosyltransferase involved in cell wall biosynthesis